MPVQICFIMSFYLTAYAGWGGGSGGGTAYDCSAAGTSLNALVTLRHHERDLHIDTEHYASTVVVVIIVLVNWTHLVAVPLPPACRVGARRPSSQWPLLGIRLRPVPFPVAQVQRHHRVRVLLGRAGEGERWGVPQRQRLLPHVRRQGPDTGLRRCVLSWWQVFFLCAYVSCFPSSLLQSVL